MYNSELEIYPVTKNWNGIIIKISRFNTVNIYHFATCEN